MVTAAMRNLLTIASGLTLLSFTACTSGPGQTQEPPVLKVTSPQRSLIQDQVGMLSVQGTVTPNPEGTPLKSVAVNGTLATLNPDGTFTANVMVQPGAQLIQTVATDAKGNTATDTRSVEAGEQRLAASTVSNALGVALSAQAFSRISGIASPMIMQADLTSLIKPMQPMVNAGGSCLGVKGYIDSLTISGSTIALTPVDGGLQFHIEVDGLNVQGHADFDVACIGGSDTFGVTADAVTVDGTLDVQPNGMMGFTTTLQNPNVNITNLQLSAGGIPSSIISLLDINNLVSFAVSKAAEMFMGPMMNKALGALSGPKTLHMLGHDITVQVSASQVNFTSSAGFVVLDSSLAISGANSTMFTFTPDGMPVMDPGNGMQFGMADDMANDMLAQVVSLNLLNLSMPAPGGTFDSANISATSPPMISADASDGKMHMILPDMKVVFTQQGTPVASAALNAKIELAITPTNNGNTIAIQLGQPALNIDVTDDIPNESHFTNDDLSKAVTLGLQSQIASISALLSAVPLPTVNGIGLSNLSMGADSGYVMIKADLQ